MIRASVDFSNARQGTIKVKIAEDNKATEYLANERTFLAWIKTSIATICLGFGRLRKTAFHQMLLAFRADIEYGFYPTYKVAP